MKRICVFCGSLSGGREVYGEQARTLGRAMAERGIGLVYGGGGVGMMGAVADAVIAAKGEVIGVIPYALASKERARRDVDMRVVNTMHERKAMMAELSDAFIAMPGGFGTFEEMMETITWGQLGIHRKPVGLLNVAGYYDLLLAMIDRGIDEGFILPHYRKLFVASAGVNELFDLMRKFQPIEGVMRWIEMSET
ncbi:MAG: TIGR00730 family Rossman fold protein [Blastocatellia bacterium]|nr:TIGR00730 family Rossman fold protein [Blastocatellia bacterium]